MIFDSRILGISVVLGLAVWTIDALLDFRYFYEGQSFLGLLLFQIPAHEIYIRSVILLFFILFWAFMSRVVAKRRLAEADLQTAYDELELRVAERTDALWRHTERLKLLQRVARATLELKSSEETGREALTGIRELLPFERAAVCMFDHQIEVSKLVSVLPGGSASDGADNSFSLAPYAEIVNVLRRGECYLLNNVSDDSDRWPFLEALALEGLHCLLAIPLCSGGDLIGTLGVAAADPHAFSEEHMEISREVSDLLAVSFQNARLFRSIDEKCVQLRTLNARLADAEECERRRLARELHDRVGQNLSALNVNMAILTGLLPAETNANVRNRIDDSLALVGDTMTCIRDVMADLRPSGLDEFGLPTALRYLAQEFARRTEAETVLETGGFSRRLAPSVEIALFRIAQEALTNITRHAQAQRVDLTLEDVKGATRLVIADDGIGYSPQAFRSPAEQQRGWGLIGMRERAEAAGGMLKVESAPGKGTRILVELQEGPREYSCISGR